MPHHPSCTQNDKSLVYMCHQCGTQEPAEHLEDLRSELNVEKRYVAGYRDEFLKATSEIVKLKKLCGDAALWMDGIAEPHDHPLRVALLKASK